MSEDKTKLSALRKQNKKLRERAKKAEGNLKDDFIGLRAVLQEMGELLGLDGTFIAHFGTDHIFARLSAIMMQMDMLETALLMIAESKDPNGQNLSHLAAIVLATHFDWKHSNNLEDTGDHLQNRQSV